MPSATGSSTTAEPRIIGGCPVMINGTRYASSAGGTNASSSRREKCRAAQAKISTRNGPVPAATPPNAHVEKPRTRKAGSTRSAGARRCQRCHGSTLMTAADTRSAAAMISRSPARRVSLAMPMMPSSPERANNTAT
ncbi:hypothetical protein DMB66_07120 [Actinoplanes sp. ATCC 53533]|nr:hypothetical protein DMB66_07120 [Actinoplanes sp. ATCC 53533]